ncbi:hypothetical protein [Candidatus Electronema sp. PJ]|uniref:hypothetical protein n=1 Tax=Candidatus Electronema sp. PJ TaxID=3401572 RepID=UPI003AA9542A
MNLLHTLNQDLRLCLLLVFSCLLLTALPCQAEEQNSSPPSVTISGSGIALDYPTAGVPTKPEEPLSSLADDFFDVRTLKIIFAETDTKATYQLTDASLAAIKKMYPFIPDKQYEQLAEMKDNKYREDDLAWGKVEALLAQLELHRSGVLIQYIVQDTLLEEMKKAELPPFIIEGIQDLNGTRYLNLTMLESGLQEQIREKILAYKSDIMATANFLNMVYFLSSNSLLILKGKGVPAPLVDKLAVLEGKYYITRYKLAGEVQKILAQFAQDPTQEWVKKTVELAKKHSHLYLLKANALSQMLMNQPPDVVRAVRWENRNGYSFAELTAMLKANAVLLQNYFRQNQRILAEADIEKTVTYQPNEPNAEQMRKRGVKQEVEKAVARLYGNEYPTQLAYVQALIKNRYPPLPIDDDKQNVPIKFPVLVVPPFRPARPPIVLDIANLPQPIKVLMADKLRLSEPKDYTLAPINLKTGNCGCVAVPENTVYGLYPYWSAAGKPSQVDFSAVSRLGYFYLRIDKDNQIKNLWHWQKDYSAFVNQARQHKVKVDLVIYKEDWGCLTEHDNCPAGKKAEELTEIILAQLSTKLDNDLLNTIKPYASFGDVPMATMGDGIMLYLTDLPDNYPCFLSFVKLLRERLLDLPVGALSSKLAQQQPLPDKRLSLLIPDEFILRAVDDPDFQDFFVQVAKEPGNFFDDIVVALEKKPAETEKQIRLVVEQKFPDQQAVLNQKIIPLLTDSCGEKLEVGELYQTLQYAKNNFAGIGLFPLPFIEKGGDKAAKKEEMKAPVCGGGDMYRLVKQQFQVKHEDQADTVGQLMNHYAPWLCQWACPIRWWIRIAWDILLIFFAVYIVLAFFYPALEDICRAYKWLFWLLAVITGILIYISFACDPIYINKATDFLILLLVALVVIIRFAVVRKDYP